MIPYACQSCGDVVLMLPCPVDFLVCEGCGAEGSLEPVEEEQEVSTWRE